MYIYEVKTDKKAFLDLLLLADEQEDMIDRYLEPGKMYVLEEDGTKAICVTLPDSEDTLEIKNLATAPEHQHKGYGRAMIDYIAEINKDLYDYLLVGTGDSPLTVPFYEKCGFIRSHVLENFFIDNYDHEIIEDGVKLVDMVYFKKPI